jgi:hypothetical protein
MDDVQTDARQKIMQQGKGNRPKTKDYLTGRNSVLKDEIKAALKTIKKQSKYRNQKIDINGQKFDSKKESDRFTILKLLSRQGTISNLDRQVKYEIIVENVKICTYIADFVYRNEKGELIVEDVKSLITKRNSTYILKKKLMKAIHKIEIKET